MYVLCMLNGVSWHGGHQTHPTLDFFEDWRYEVYWWHLLTFIFRPIRICSMSTVWWHSLSEIGVVNQVFILPWIQFKHLMEVRKKWFSKPFIHVTADRILVNIFPNIKNCVSTHISFMMLLNVQSQVIGKTRHLLDNVPRTLFENAWKAQGRQRLPLSKYIIFRYHGDLPCSQGQSATLYPIHMVEKTW